MKLAASNIAWAVEENDAAARILLDAGARGVEVAPGTLFEDPFSASEQEIATVRRVWNDRGLDIVSLQALLYGRPDLRIFGDRAARERTAKQLRSVTRMAAALGAGAMVFGSPRNRLREDMPVDVAERIAAEFFGELGAYAAERGLALCLEANAPAYGCDFICRTKDAVALVRRVDHPGFRVQVDTSTMAMNGEDYLTAIGMALPYAAHVHISEPHLGPVGPHGQVPVKTVLEAIDAGHYNGWVSVEMRPVTDGRNLDALRVALQYVTDVREAG